MNTMTETTEGTMETTVQRATKSIHEAFAQGWRDGADGTAAETARETEARYPYFGACETTAYLNGAEDGAQGDRFRLDMSEGTVDAFAARVEREQREWVAREYPQINLDSDQYRAAVRPGRTYTRVDFGGSGKYMVVNATGEIFGIKGYGVIHRGHRYGTLATVDEWYWSGYVARQKVTA